MKKTIAALAASLAVAGFAASALAEGDAEHGEKVFKKCKVCHAVGEGATNKVGPELNGVVGRTAGSVEGFKYSNSMAAKKDEGMVWTEEALDAFLTKPKDVVPGTKMGFGGLSKPEDRADVIAYLKTFQ